jgi:transcriptional regulator with XRE-family HTH domain/plasmid maintenance system antidote protein VapI
MTPNQARAARAMLNLDMKTVCELAPVGKRTLTEFEAGGRTVNDVTMSKLKAFYISRGISFGNSVDDAEAVTLRNSDAAILESASVPRAKEEYVDLFDTSEIEKVLASVSGILRELEGKVDFSRASILTIIRIARLNQKELAAILDCSPAFINAIAVGRKYIPPSMAEKLQLHLSDLRVDIKAAVEIEKKLKSAISEMLKISASAGQAIKAIYPGISAI